MSTLTTSSLTTRPILSLASIFILWKSYLLAIAFGTGLGSDYDTSTSILFQQLYTNHTSIPSLALKLTRWDAFYFVHAARDGYIYEQEWAFGTALPASIWTLKRLIHCWLDLDHVAGIEPVMAIGISHFAHFFAVVALYHLTVKLFRNTRLAYVASVLHIISPAGVFLSAPYAESSCACLTFLGQLLFATCQTSDCGGFKRSIALLASGAVFALATVFRSNGLLNGILFAIEAASSLLEFVRNPRLSKAFAIIPPVMGGIFIAIGSAGPQFIAWQRYCVVDAEGHVARPWCSSTIPSIYTFVQEHYWNNGFLRYWTLNQLPLFLLASPILMVMIKSGVDTIRSADRGLMQRIPNHETRRRVFLFGLTICQVLVATLAITNFHVQIITRLSSGYPVWYWWVASLLQGGEKGDKGLGTAVVVFMVMYCSIQGGLFASFLPPA